MTVFLQKKALYAVKILLNKKNHNRKRANNMTRVSKNKVQRKKEKQARKKQRKIKKAKRYQKRPLLSLEQRKKKKAQRSKENRKEQRKNKEKERESAIAKRIQWTLSSIFDSTTLEALAKITGFIKRKGGELLPYAYMYTMSYSFFGNGKTSLANLTSMLHTNFNIKITPQALSKKINTKYSVRFLSKIFKKLLSVQLKIKLKNKATDVFSMFTAVNLQDSTQVSLHPSLAKDFAGSGGSASKAALKLDCIFDIANSSIQSVRLIKGTVPDQKLAKDILKHVKESSLSINDLGYFELATKRKIEEKKGFYISRLSIRTNVYSSKSNKHKLDILQFLKRKCDKGEDSVSCTVYIGSEERFKTRLIAEKVPKHVSQQRQDRYKRDNSKEPNKYYTEWCGYSIFITNIPPESYSSIIIIAIYKIRWQIELIFKNFKSNVELDRLTGTNKYRIESLIYGRLITITTLFIIQNYAAHIALQREVSSDKLTKWLSLNSRLCLCILNGSILQLLRSLEIDILRVCKQQRKRRTTLEHIETLIDDQEKLQDNICVA